MKTRTTNVTGILDRWTCFLGFSLRAGLMAALVVPAIAVSQPQLPVSLGAADGFAVLAGSLISSVPTSAITGDVGLSPASGSNITGLTAPEVTGTIYAVDAFGPAGSVADPILLTAAKGDLTIAFNDAAGRTPVPTGNFLNPGGGNIGGLTLVAGLYKFTSSALITGSNVTLTGSSTDVWIFQIANDLTVGNGIQVILVGGAKASNIFWQVGTSATLGTTSVFKGTIMADQSIALNNLATVEGRTLARIGAVTLVSNTVVIDFIVPVELTSFSAFADNNNIVLSWGTVTETNNYGFEIYRNGNNIAFVEGNGTTTETQDYSFVDVNLQSGIYNYRLSQQDFNGTHRIVGELTVHFSVPEQFVLEQNYPNPFNPSTTINFSIPASGLVTLKVFNALGSEVATLVNEQKEPGSYQVEFEADNYSTGIYFYNLQAGNFVETRKMLLMK